MAILIFIGLFLFFFAHYQDNKARVERQMLQFDGLCASCKWMNQGESGCHCFNPEQTDANLKQYVYWIFSCGIYERGDQLSEFQLNELGYKRKSKVVTYYNGLKEIHYYYDNTN